MRVPVPFLPCAVVSVLGATLCVPTARAQYSGEGPGVVAAMAPAIEFDPVTLGNGITTIKSLLLVPHPARPRGVYYLCATAVISGGAGGNDAVAGVYDANTGTFTKNNDVDHLNSSGSEFQPSVSPDLLTFVMDTPSGAIWASRTSIAQPFGSAARVAGVPGGYIDPNLAMVEGKLSLLFVTLGFGSANGSDLSVGDFNAATGQVTNARRVVAIATAAPRATGLHSPSPINDAQGQMRAIVFASTVSGRNSNAFFNTGIEAATPSFEIMDTPTWLNNPDANGGRVVFAEGSTTPQGISLLALSSASVPSSGGTLTFSAWMPPRISAVVPYSGTVVLGTLGSAPTPLPFAKGSPLSLNPAAPLIVLPGGLFDLVNGDLAYSLPLPPLPPGLTVHGVPVAVDLTTAEVWVGNTAFYSIR